MQLRRYGIFRRVDDSATARDEDAAEVCRRPCSRAANPGSQLPACVRRAVVASLRQTRDRVAAAQPVAAIDDMSGEEGFGVTFLVVRISQNRPVSDVCT